MQLHVSANPLHPRSYHNLEKKLYTYTNEVSVIDTTGAGDNFAAGFLYGLSKNFTLKDCASFGNLIAGEVLKVYGPRIEKSLKKFIVD